MRPDLVPRDIWKNVAGLLLVIAALALLVRFFDIESIRLQIESSGPIAPLLFILAKASTVVIAPLGGSPLYPLAGALFGFWKGSALLILGDMVGGIISFYLSRFFGRPLVERMIGDDKGILSRAIELMSTTRGYFIARLCFLSIPEFASYGAGLTKIRFLPFVVIYTSIGAIPSLVLAGFGDLLTESGNKAFIPLLVLGGALISAVSFAFFLNIISKEPEPKDTEGA